MKKRSFTVLSNMTAAAVAAELARRSVWFEFTPLPDDEYELSVHDDDAATPLLREFASIFGAKPVAA